MSGVFRLLLCVAVGAVVVMLSLPVDLGPRSEPIALAAHTEIVRQGGSSPGPALVGLLLATAAVLVCLSPSPRSLAFLVLLANIGAYSLWITRAYDTTPGRAGAMGAAAAGILCGTVLVIVGKGGVGMPRWIWGFGIGVVAFGLVSLYVFRTAMLDAAPMEIGAPLRFIAITPGGVRWSIPLMFANAGVWGLGAAMLAVAWAVVMAGSGRVRVS